jgi:hypothetical protein
MRNTPTQDEAAERFDDLDALVMAEIESVGRGRPLRTPAARARPPGAGRRPARGRVREGPAAPRSPSRIYGEDRSADGVSGEEADGLFDLPLETDDEGLVDSPSTEPQGLFSPEEQAFVSRAVGFLSGHENADMILGQIWERITEEAPEAFFRPADTPPPATVPNAEPAPELESHTEQEPPGA